MNLNNEEPSVLLFYYPLFSTSVSLSLTFNNLSCCIITAQRNTLVSLHWLFFSASHISNLLANLTTHIKEIIECFDTSSIELYETWYSTLSVCLSLCLSVWRCTFSGLSEIIWGYLQNSNNNILINKSSNYITFRRGQIEINLPYTLVTQNIHLGAIYSMNIILETAEIWPEHSYALLSSCSILSRIPK